MQVHLLRLERLCPETGKKSWREINRLSFARFLVRKIIKREVDGEINFKNPFYKKLGTRKFLLAADRKMEYEVKGRELVEEKRKLHSFDRFVLKIIG